MGGFISQTAGRFGGYGYGFGHQAGRETFERAAKPVTLERMRP